MSTKGRVNYREWLFRVATWDILVVLCITLIPAVLVLVLPRNPNAFWKQPGAVALAAAILPPIAFLVRIKAGRRHIASNRCSGIFRLLQLCVFFIGIVPLLVADCLVVVSHDLPGAPMGRDDVMILMIIYVFYLMAMVFAMYPGREPPQPDEWENEVA